MTTLSPQEVATHCKKDDLWIMFEGRVYDLTGYIDSHPGGLILLNHAGKDATAAILGQKAHQYVFKFIHSTLEKHFVGDVVTSDS